MQITVATHIEQHSSASPPSTGNSSLNTIQEDSPVEKKGSPSLLLLLDVVHAHRKFLPGDGGWTCHDSASDNDLGHFL